MLTKNLPKNKLALTLFFRMILDGLAALRFLFLGKFQHFAAVFNAHISFYSSFVTVYKQRDRYQRLDFFKVQSIVWRYFVNGKKKFG
ncbi:MAG TPA: glycosyltransferase family 2 protein, partial [Flavobacterium sp.]|nr:glycosyltransferase family 2 protein [Flavobacterium sp.]